MEENGFAEGLVDIEGFMLFKTQLKRMLRYKLSYDEKIEAYQKKYHSKVYFEDTGHRKIVDLVARNTPFFLSRIGSVELSGIVHYINFREGRSKKVDYPDHITKVLRRNAGVFPQDNESIDVFCEVFLDSIKDVTALGVWFNNEEWHIQRKYCKTALLVELGCLNSFLFSNPYTSCLKGKKVLLIHPFEKSMKKQYEQKRKCLFSDPMVLPEFELITVCPPQTAAGSDSEFGCWKDALENTISKIDGFDYEIAIIGAGAYGLPLGGHIKRQGKSVIHLGGATQLLFGVKGRRWETEYNFDKQLFNEHWIYPDESEKPIGYKKVEGGCYW